MTVQVLEDGSYLSLAGGVDLDQAMLEVATFWCGQGLDGEEAVELAETHSVRFVRRFPWCVCTGDHDWHIEPAKPGARGAFPVLIQEV